MCVCMYASKYGCMCGCFSNFETSKLIFFGKETTSLLSVRRWMSIRASEESLFCAASITFLPQKTADILNYAQRQRASQENE